MIARALCRPGTSSRSPWLHPASRRPSQHMSLIACSTGAGEPSGAAARIMPATASRQVQRRATCRRCGRTSSPGPSPRERWPGSAPRATSAVSLCPPRETRESAPAWVSATPARPGSPASPRHAGRRPPDRCAPGCPRRRPAFGGDRPAVVDPGQRSALVPHETLEPMWCGQHGLVSRVGESSGQRQERRHLAPGSQRQISRFTGRLAHRGSGPSVPSTRAATPSASPWTLRPVRHGACGRRSSRQRPPRTRPH